MSKNNYDQFNLPPTGPNLCDFYGQYIGFGGGGPTGVQLTSIAKSALFDSANSEYLSITPSGAGNLRKWTLSLWAYRTDFGTGEFKLWSAISSSNFDMVAFTGNELGIEINTASSSTNSLRSNALFRDQGWYHIVVVWDSDNSTATNRIRAWVNGKRITSWRVSAFPGSAGVDSLTNSTVLHTLGAKANVSQYFDGYLAESVLINGSALEPTSFAEYDPTGTFWVPKSPAVIKALTFGSTGFYLDNATNAQTDAGSEGNNFTNNNTVLTSSHTCTNMFNLFNSFDHTTGANFVLSNGNQTADADATNKWGTCTLPVATGKWFAVATTTDANSRRFGVVSNQEGLYDLGSGAIPTDQSYGWAVGLSNNTTIAARNSSTNITGTIQTIDRTEDRYVVAIDCDNKKLWLGVYDQSAGNIQYVDSGGTVRTTDVPASGSNETYTLTGTSWRFFCEHGDTGSAQTIDFGQNSFNSATVPTGFNTSLNTTAIAAATTRTKSDLSEYFESIVYEGNGFGQRVGRHLPFTNSYTVAKSGLFTNANSEDLSRGSMSGTANTFTMSMWVKRSQPAVGVTDANFMFTTASDAGLAFGNNSTADLLSWYSGSYTASTQVFSDESLWMNVVFKSSSGTGTAYVNGVQILGSLTVNGADATMAIGSYNNASNFWDGYISEVVFIDGTALEPASFGETDAATGAWVPKSVSGLTFGSNGFHLDFADSSAMGNDISGNNNDFTDNNTVVQVADSPTTNFGTLLSNLNAAEVLTNGNRSTRGVSGQSYFCLPSGLRMTTEKIFVACRMDDGADGSSQVNVSFGCHPPNANIDSGVGPVTDSYAGIDRQGGDFRVYNNQYDDAPGAGFSESHTISAADTDVITMAVDPSDPSNGKVWFGVYDTSEDSHQYIPNVVGGTAGDPALGTLPTVDGINFKGDTNPLGEWRIFTGGYRHTAATTVLLDSTDIPITIPSGFLEYKQSNIKKGRTVATGASANEITPSYTTAWNWIKNRDAADSHMIFDRVRGVGKDIHTDAADVEVTDSNTMFQFLRGGVQVGNDVQVNTQKESYVSWQWYMEATGTGTSNEDGTINTTSTLVDTNLGLSISEYTGTGANATIGHGLGVAPTFVIIKRYNSASHNWIVGVNSGPVDFTDRGLLQVNQAFADNATEFNDTNPTSSVISLGSSSDTNSSSQPHICYAFAPSQFNAIGSYKGNGNADGTFVPTTNSLGIPITPSWIMLKRTDTANAWAITDTGRTPTNPTSLILQGDLPNAELDNNDIDVLHGGFKIRSTDNLHNNASGNYIYLAFGTPIIDTDGRIITAR